MAKKMTVKAPKRAHKSEWLLVEILTEELPPKSLKRLSEAFTNGIVDGLKEKHFIGADTKAESFATPRRLAVRVAGVIATQADRNVERKGPSVQAGVDANGQPTQALLGFARSCSTDVKHLERRKDDKGEYFVFQLKQKGEPLANHLAAIVEAALKKLPVAKLMRWGSGEAQFVRPVHGVIMLHGSNVVPGTVLGLKSGNKTLGHRFLSKGALTIARAADYEKLLKTKGSVVASFEQRRETIVQELDKAASKLGKGTAWRLGKEMELVDEVTSIVESPRVYVGEFDPAFLDVPLECLVVSMQQHQKYFPVADGSGKLLAKFLFVANMHPKDASQIVHGNERVLRARLSDAKFFYDQDRKHKLEERVARLAQVVYHNKLGSQLERVQRIQKLAGSIAGVLNADIAAAERAAHLCKADLLTEMVGEFPELQGIMGRYYARHDGEPAAVADAIEQHYFPKSAGGELPRGAVAVAAALADKLDTLVGIFGVGLAPTGDKDPFGLRRAAVGVIRILLEQSLPLDLRQLFDRAHGLFPGGLVSATVGKDLHDFVLDRLRPYLRERGYAPDEIDAVLSLNPTQLDHVIPRLEALKKFRALPEGMALAAANKRIRNILRQAGGKIDGTVNPALLTEAAETALAQAVQAAAGDVGPLVSGGDYAATLKRLAALRPAVDEFFDKVMVMADDTGVRANRLALLNSLGALFLHVADVSKLQG
jgi:glycyl-tRNA synthetase beta chain